MARFLTAALLAAITLPLLPSCASGAADTDSSAPAEASLADLNLGEIEQAGIPNLTMHEDLYSGGLLCTGQLSEEQMAMLKTQGVKSFVSLRRATEKGAGWEEAYAQENDVNFTRMEIAGAAGVTLDAAKNLDALLAESEGPVVLYCGSSNRVGTLVGLAAHAVDGMPKDEALALAEASGMKSLTPVFRKLIGLE